MTEGEVKKLTIDFAKAMDRADRRYDGGWGAEPNYEIVERWLAFSQIRIAKLGGTPLSEWNNAKQQQLNEEVFVRNGMKEWLENRTRKAPTIQESVRITRMNMHLKP